MFQPEESNEKIGEYLKNIIEHNFESHRAFCKSYLQLRYGSDPTPEELNNMANRLSQITKGNKAIQFYDLPYFIRLLGISCEHILSAGECCVPANTRVTNYSIACSKNPEEWEAYIHRPDKLILNCDEYGKTVLDYAIEFRNYDFIKYLVEHDYIWFDDGSDTPHFRYFRAGTSIEPRKQHEVDYGLFYALNKDNALRKKLIILAIDQNDIPMLQYFHAEADAELYAAVSGSAYRASYAFDFDKDYGLDMLRHIVASNEYVLDYFTDSFAIEHHISDRVLSHRFLFPPISRLLDLLIQQKSKFTETALKKALKHNQETYNKLLQLLTLVKNDEFYNHEWTKDLWKAQCKGNLKFDKNSSTVSFHTVCICRKPNDMEGIITNVVHISKLPDSPILKHLAEEINELYDKIRNIGEHLDEI